MVLQLAAAGLLGPSVASGVASANETFLDILSIDTTNYPTVYLNLSVDTSAGRDGLLTEEDFEIIEDGIQKEIQSFEFGSTKTDLVFVFDDTGSMGNEISGMKSEVSSLVSEIEAAGIDSRYGLVTFKDNVTVDLGMTGDASQLQDAVADLNASGGGDFPEDNFDAILRALEFDFRSDAQKILVDITDATSHYRGDGSGISESTINEAGAALTDNGVAYVAVSPGYTDERSAKKVLAENVDGTWLDIYDADFTDILGEITELVVTAYVVEYVTDLLPGQVGPVKVVVTDPDEGTDSTDGEVDVPSDVDGGYLEELLTEKDDIIDEVQALAGQTIGDDRAESYVDTEAAQLLEDIRNDDLGGSNAQYTEAVERMIAAENVTRSATSTVTGGNSPTRTNIENLFSLTKGIAVELLSAAAGGAIRTAANSIVSSLIRRFDDLLGSFSGRGAVPYTVTDSASNRINRATTRSYYKLKGYSERYPEDTQEIVETAGSQGLEVGELIAGGLLDQLDEDEGFVDFVEEIYFSGYYFESGWPDVHIPSPDEIQLPPLEFSYDLPDENLGAYSFLLPDEVSLSYDPPDIDLPDELETLIDVLNEVETLAGSGGVGNTIDDRMDDLRDAVGDLDLQDDETREVISDGLSRGTEGLGKTSEVIIEALEDLQGLLKGASSLAGYLSLAAVVGAAVTAATGVGPATLLPAAVVLAKAAAVIGIVALAVDGVQIGVGQEYLSGLTKVHQVGTYSLTETTLGGVDL